MSFTWEYRIIEDADGDYAIHEVHTDEDGTTGYTESPSAPLGNDLKELRADFEWMKLAFDKPVLKASDFDDNSGSNT